MKPSTVLSRRRSKPEGPESTRTYLIAWGLIGDPTAPVMGSGGVEIFRIDRLPRIEPIFLLQPRNVEQHAARGELVAKRHDAVLLRTVAVHGSRWPVVVHLSIEEYVRQGIPLRGTLQGHHHRI